MSIINKLESTNVTIVRGITFSKNETPLSVIEVEGDRCSDAILPIGSIKPKAMFYNDIINFVKKYNGNAEVPFNYFNRFYLTNLNTGKKYARLQSFPLKELFITATTLTISQQSFVIRTAGNLTVISFLCLMEKSNFALTNSTESL